MSYPRVHNVIFASGINRSDEINAAADRHKVPPRLVVAQGLAESNLNETAERWGTPPDISFGAWQQTPKYAPIGDHSHSPENIALVRERFTQDFPYALDVAASQLGAYWGSHQNGPEAMSRYNGGPAMKLANNPNARHIVDSWERSARYVVEEGTVARYAFPIVGYHGPINNHWGTSERGGSDIFAPKGTPLVVMCSGRVSYAGFDPLGGWNVVIDGDDGLTYYEAHLNTRPLVQTGQAVRTGQPLGEVGDTGNAAGTGPHLHIGIGYGIRTGSGAGGGCGINFDAVGLLQRVLAGQPEEEEDMARIQELEEANARLNEELAECRSYSSAVGHDILLPTVRELEAERAKTAGKRRWMDKSAQWVERLAPHIVEDAG